MSRKRPASSSSDQPPKQQRYEDTDLLGLKVSHSESLFKEGQDVILTLKDANVLDNEEDVLENVNLTDLEKANRNVENKTNKADYNPFDEPEYDSFGRFKKKGLLSKYDEEINGLKNEAFRIGLDEKRLEGLQEIKNALSNDKGEISLQMPKYRIASEYFTEEEIVSFKKPKRSKKSSKKSSSSKTTDAKITADSLLSLDNENGYNEDEDHGSRNRTSRRTADVEDEVVDEAFLEHQNLLQNAIKKKIKQKSSSTASRSTNASDSLRHQSKKVKTENDQPIDVKRERDLVDEPMNESESEDDFEIPDEEIYGVVLEEDDLQRDLMRSLEKARKLKQKERTETEENLAKISETLQAINEDEMKAESSRSLQFGECRSDIVINSTAEFCRNLGDLSTLKYSKQEEELLDFEKDLLEDKEEEEEDRMDIDDDEELEEKYKVRNKWNEVDFKTEQPKTSDLIESKQVILEEEPDVSRGLAGALKLSMKKGYLDKEIKKANISVKASSLQAKNYTIEEKFYEDDKFSRRERYSGGLSEFREKANYKPDIKLEYNDDHGRQLSTKEAFRVLSHKFHGKGMCIVDLYLTHILI